MQIFWDNDLGQPMFMLDQITRVRDIRTVYDFFKLHGVLYMIDFFWEGSPYISEMDKEKRHLQVLQNTCTTEEFDIFKGKLIQPPTRSNQPHYSNIHLINGGKAINSLAPVPELLQLHWYESQIKGLRDKVAIKWDECDTDDKVKAALNRQKLVLSNIDTMEKAYNQILGLTKDKMKKEIASSLSDFINNKDGQLEESDGRNGKLEISEN